MSQKREREKRRNLKLKRQKEQDDQAEIEQLRSAAIGTLEKIKQDVHYAEGIVIDLLYGRNVLQNPIHRSAVERVLNHYKTKTQAAKGK